MEVLRAEDFGYGRTNEVDEELERVLHSKSFRRASRLQGLLRYVVSSALNGKSSEERRTAQELFGKPADFDPSLDPVIRVQFGRLRTRLTRYYETEGSADPVVIRIPRRSYTPTFHLHNLGQSSEKPNAPTLVKGTERNGAGAAHGVGRSVERPQESSDPDVARSETKSVAVLPFANLTTDPKQDAFCYGLTEEIANALAAVKSLSVVASSSTFQFKDEHVDVRDVGRELGVLLILEGSVRVERGQARVTAQLARSEDGVAIWSDSFDAKINGSLNTQRVMARKVLGSLPLAS